MTEVQEPLRDQIGRALYEEPGHDVNWYDLSEEKREPWRLDADRVIPIAEEHFKLLKVPSRAHSEDLLDTLMEVYSDAVNNGDGYLGRAQLEYTLMKHDLCLVDARDK